MAGSRRSSSRCAAGIWRRFTRPVPPRLVAGEQLGRPSPPRLVLEIDAGELLAVVIAHHVAGRRVLRLTRAAGSGAVAAKKPSLGRCMSCGKAAARKALKSRIGTSKQFFGSKKHKIIIRPNQSYAAVTCAAGNKVKLKYQRMG